MSSVLRLCVSRARSASGVWAVEPSRASGRGRRAAPGPGGFDQRIQRGTGVGTPEAAGERELLPADHERADGVLGRIVVEFDVGVFEEGIEPRPQVEDVVDGRAQSALGSALGALSSKQTFDLVQDRPGVFLADGMALLGCLVPDLALDLI